MEPEPARPELQFLARFTVDPTAYTFRIHLALETASTAHGWLNRAVAVGSAPRLPDAVVYDASVVA